MSTENKISRLIRNSAELKLRMAEDRAFSDKIGKAAEACHASLSSGGKILLCGNGGSAADAQHLAAEFTGRFYQDRPPLFAEALHVNTSYLTAVANDYGYDVVYSRMVQAVGKAGDLLIGLSTSGNSVNIMKAMEEARKIGMITVGFTGETGGKMKPLCDHLINVPSTDTPRIQESHITIGHIICEIVEERLFKKEG
ncbi:MAG: SIS domain-containing protein [Chitinophagia bacterium]|nr:SIS domain-containing protein [Chitinophagia bacterium]